jgi:cephalosporin hydroxylase
MNEAIEFYIQNARRRGEISLQDNELQDALKEYQRRIVMSEYTKGFTWMGIPVIQYPTDLVAMQEVIWKVKPNIIIESGVAFGGMMSFYATMLEAIGRGKVIGIDIDPRVHNIQTLNEHPLQERMMLIRGSSTAPHVFDAVRNEVQSHVNPVVLVSLDSNHTKKHVLEELQLYAPLVTPGSYIVVFDTAIEFFGDLDPFQNRPWGKWNNPYSAVLHFLDMENDFENDQDIENRYQITAAPGGWLRRIR